MWTLERLPRLAPHGVPVAVMGLDSRAGSQVHRRTATLTKRP